MKPFLALVSVALAAFCSRSAVVVYASGLSSLGGPSGVRRGDVKGGDEAGEGRRLSPTEKIRAAIEDIERNHQRRSLVETSACNCTEVARDEILEASQETFWEVFGPNTSSILDMMEDHTDAISDTLGGLDVTPLIDIDKVVGCMMEIVDKALEALNVMLCGPCDGDNSTDVCPGINRFECCCDVNFIRDLTIEQIRGIAEIATLNPGASQFITISIDAIKRTTMVAIMEKSLPYIECNCPCFSLDDIRAADDNSQFDRCQNVVGKRKVIDFDVIKKEDELSFAYCVGKSCEKNCIVHNTTGDCLQEIIGEQSMCYGGMGYLGRPYPYQWLFNVTTVRNITESQEEACCAIMQDFCTAKGDPMDVDNAGIATVSDVRAAASDDLD